MLSSGTGNLDEESRKMLHEESSFAKICGIIHNDFMTASQVSHYNGNTQMLDESKENITVLLSEMKTVEGFNDFFYQDLMKRAKDTIEKILSGDNVLTVNLRTLRSVAKDV